MSEHRERQADERTEAARAAEGIASAFVEYEEGRASIAQLLAALWRIRDDLCEAVFPGSVKDTLSERVVGLLEANNREVERRRALEEEHDRLRLIIPSLLSVRRFDDK